MSIGLINDFKDFTRQIEELLPSAIPAKPVSSTAQPFARIDKVLPNSPSHKAVCTQVYASFPIILAILQGLLVGDLIIKFGQLDKSTFHNMTDISATLSASIDAAHPLILKVLRGTTAVTISITNLNHPLGIYIVPI